MQRLITIVAALLLCFGLAATASPANALTQHQRHKIFVQDCMRLPVIGHRGMGENTTHYNGRAYTEDGPPALTEGGVLADGFETDFHLDAPTPAPTDGTTLPGITIDGMVYQLISNHDRGLDRTTDGTGLIANHDWAYLSTIKTDDGQSLATFHDVAAIQPDKQAQLELKEDFPTAVLQFVVDQVRQERAGQLGKVMFTSGYLRDLRIVKQLAPRVKTGLIGYGMARPALARVPSYVDSINVKLQQPRRYIRRARHMGFGVSLRLVDTGAQLRRAVHKGATQVVSNRPWLARNKWRICHG